MYEAKNLASSKTLQFISVSDQLIVVPDNDALKFPEKGILPFTTDEFFLKLKETAEAFLNFVQNVVFDIQFDIQEILTKEEQKRIQRNMIKIKEKVYNTQSLELEESLPQSVISMTTKFVKVCNMKVEDKVRQN